MNLRQQLDQLLPSLLPSDPKEALKGTELIRLVRLKLEGDYSDASLRFHFSTLAGDPNSPIAKVDKSQGYYKRSDNTERPLSAIQQPLLASLALDEENSETPLEIQRQQKLVILALLHYEQTTKWCPYLLTPPPGAGECDPWLAPQLLLADSPFTEDEKGFHQDTKAIKTRQLLGLPPLPLHGISMLMTASPSLYRAQFFRALSASAWMHSGELLFAEAVTDDALVQALQYLGSRHGLGVSSLGISIEQLDEFPPASEIMNMDPVRIESILERLDPIVLVPPPAPKQPDSFALDEVRKNAPHIDALLESMHGVLDF